ncbi:tail completion protein gp17 [Ketogulonicigenium vulgare]|uniref:tail completion protein gp17 n=1 Tax=Ketogulonicigenium vulgare TaxID=92945 RepID=UPI002359020A|nr:DUF3168 domain-containing protein [Ketogulonicigenium vulgare]
MFDPTSAFTTMIGDRLAADPAITEHVDPLHIRAGFVRPDNLPAIILSPARVRMLGHASGHQLCAEVRLMLHVWAVEDGTTAQVIVAAMMRNLMDAPSNHDLAELNFGIDGWDRPEVTWMRDPDPARTYTHGVVALRAVLRWRAD